MAKNKENIAEYVALFPNVMLGIHKDHYYAYWLEPINHERTLEHMEIYYVGDEAAKSKKYKHLRMQNHKLWEDIQKEDVDIIKECKLAATLLHIMVEIFLLIWIIRHTIFTNG